MSHDLYERLNSYAADAAPEVTVGPEGAWRSGRRRRRARRVALTGAAAALATGVVFMAVAAPGNVWSEPAANRPGVDEHPARIAHPWFAGELEADSGPLAGFLMTEGLERFAITHEGGVLEIAPGETMIDAFPPALSSDGTKIGYLRDPTTYVVQDLAGGMVVEFDEIGDNRSDSTLPYMTAGQAPGFWSPSGDRLLITGWRTEDMENSKLLLGLDGTIATVPGPRRPAGDSRDGFPAGWTDNEHLGWVQQVRHDGSRAYDFVVTDVSGEEMSRTPLDARAPGALLSQWTGNLSSDGTRLLLSFDPPDPTWLIDSETGQVVAEGNGRDTIDCISSWRGDEPMIPAFLPNADNSGSELTTLAGERTVVVDPAFGASCIVLASDALTGESANGPATVLFGTSDTWISWHYLEIAAGALMILFVGVALVWITRRRRMLTA